jgi:hypothetical protein
MESDREFKDVRSCCVRNTLDGRNCFVMQLLWCRCWSRASNPLCPARVSSLLAVVYSPLISQRSPAILIALQASTPATSRRRRPSAPSSLTFSSGEAFDPFFIARDVTQRSSSNSGSSMNDGTAADGTVQAADSVDDHQWQADFESPEARSSEFAQR